MKKFIFFLVPTFAFVTYSIAQTEVQTNMPVKITSSATPNPNNSGGDLTYGRIGFYTDNLLGENVRLESFYNNGQFIDRGGFRIYTRGADGMVSRFSVGSNGNVGVGIASPAYKLEVNGEIRANRMHFSYSTPLDWGNLAGQSRFRWTHEDTDQINLKLQYSKNAGSTWANGLVLNSSGVVRVGDYEVWHAGNLTPAKRGSLLSADMNTYTDPGVYEYDGAGANVVNGPTGSPNFRVLSMGSNLRQTQMAFLWDGNRAFFRRKTDQGFSGWSEFWHNGNFNPAAYLPLSGGNVTGNIVIGTTAAQRNLDVNGDIKTRKVKVTITDWADYVFDPSYHLAPIAQVEQFIRENKHLPEVPSASEVEKEGLDLGNNQAVLLKKIEELTLYIIQQNRQIELQNKQLEQQNNKMKQIEKRLTDMEAK